MHFPSIIDCPHIDDTLKNENWKKFPFFYNENNILSLAKVSGLKSLSLFVYCIQDNSLQDNMFWYGL